MNLVCLRCLIYLLDLREGPLKPWHCRLPIHTKGNLQKQTDPPYLYFQTPIMFPNSSIIIGFLTENETWTWLNKGDDSELAPHTTPRRNNGPQAYHHPAESTWGAGFTNLAEIRCSQAGNPKWDDVEARLLGAAISKKPTRLIAFLISKTKRKPATNKADNVPNISERAWPKGRHMANEHREMHQVAPDTTAGSKTKTIKLLACGTNTIMGIDQKEKPGSLEEVCATRANFASLSRRGSVLNPILAQGKALRTFLTTNNNNRSSSIWYLISMILQLIYPS